MNSLTAPKASWHPIKKFLFRFFFLYFFLYCFPFPFDGFDFTTPIARPYYNFIDWLVPGVGEKLFHIHAEVAFPLFDKVDDSGYGLVFLYMNIILSATGTVIWSFADRKRKNYDKLNEWLRLYLRYFLAAYLFGYGFVKVFPSQFQAITASRLTMTVGDQSPMLLAWNFMGYSAALMKLNGIVEVIAGLLLLFRRTTTIGAIISSCTFGFIVLMDFCFNVPVRLLASHLLFMSVFLIFEDSRRLLNVFLLNRPAGAAVYAPLINHPLWRKVFFGLQIVFSISLLYSSIVKGLDAERSSGHNTAPVPLYGVYKTAYFIRNGDSIPPLETDSLRWKQLVIDGGSWNQSGIVQFSTDKKVYYNVQADTVKQILRMQSRSDTAQKYSLHYFMPDSDHILFKGLWEKDSIEVLMNKYDLNSFLLHKEKFKWIIN
jgi:hypothetical protein